MKYVMLEKPLGQGLVQMIPIIFPAILVHADVAEAISRSLGGDVKAVSAGEITASIDAVHGYSETLQLGPRTGDRERINLIDYMSMRDATDG